MDNATMIVLRKLTDSIGELNTMVKQLTEQQLKDNNRIFELQNKVKELEDRVYYLEL